MPGPWKWRRVTQVTLDLAVLAGAFFLAFVIRFEGAFPPRYAEIMVGAGFFVVLVQYASLTIAGVPSLSWRYISLFEVQRICLAILAGNSLLILLGSDGLKTVALLENLPDIPRGVVVIDLFLALVGLIGTRLGTRRWNERRAPSPKSTTRVPTLLVGAGRAGAGVVNEIASGPHIRILPLGFLDDDPDKAGLRIHGVPVVGRIDDLVARAQSSGARQVLVTIGQPCP